MPLVHVSSPSATLVWFVLYTWIVQNARPSNAQSAQRASSQRVSTVTRSLRVQARVLRIDTALLVGSVFRSGASPLRSMHYVTRITSIPATPCARVRRWHPAFPSIVRLLVAVACTLAAVPLAGGAQQVSDTTRATYQPDALSTGPFASRASLQQAAAGSGVAAATAEARLTNGDFQVGDRIAVAVAGEPTLTDTFTVREGQLLRLPNMPDVALHGVLHAELQDTLTRDLARYIKDPVVHTTPLVRVAVLGQVPRPGYYSVAADELASSLFMHAGGLMNTSDIGKTVVRRGTETVYTPKTFQTAMTNGATVDQLALRPGDEIVVGEHPPGGSFVRYLGVAAVLAGIAASIAIIATR